jgi:AbrB family looped-hinge helix DNA binding protein
MATTTISSKFQVVIPKEVREKLRLSPQQRLQVVEKGGVITLVPEVPLKSLKGALKGMSTTDIREKKGAQIITGDADLKDLPGVDYLK